MIVIILAAGKGTRMNSDIAKVLHTIHGKTLLQYVNDLAHKINPERIFVVVGFQKDNVIKTLKSDKVEFINQEKQLGTGHAVKQVIPHLGDYDEEILVLPGDVPFLSENSLNKLLQTHRLHNAAITLLTTEKEKPTGYGRILRNNNNRIEKIVEEDDCSNSEKSIKEVNAGIYCFNKNFLLEFLGKMNKNNTQQEYYLTDMVKIACKVPLRIMSVRVRIPMKFMGLIQKKLLRKHKNFIVMIFIAKT